MLGVGRSRNHRAWCPVCRTLELYPGSTGRFWRCRTCGSRIPDAALRHVLLNQLELIRLRAEERSDS
jgi:ribosomal protein L37AE/L43A